MRGKKNSETEAPFKESFLALQKENSKATEEITKKAGYAWPA